MAAGDILLNQNKVGKPCQWAVYVFSYVYGANTSCMVYFPEWVMESIGGLLMFNIYGLAYQDWNQGSLTEEEGSIQLTSLDQQV